MATLNADMNFYAKDGFKPDKESTWKFPATSDGWYRIHDTIRAEIAKIGGCLAKCAARLDPRPHHPRRALYRDAFVRALVPLEHASEPRLEVRGPARLLHLGDVRALEPSDARAPFIRSASCSNWKL